MRTGGTASAIVAALLCWASAAVAQDVVGRAAMMRRLGITALVPGGGSEEGKPGAVNYDEVRANPYPLPDPLRFSDGSRVRTPADWSRRRAEIRNLYAREVYGEVPPDVPSVAWRVVAEERERIGFPTREARVRQLRGRVARPDEPTRGTDIRMTVVTPTAPQKPVPLLILFARDGWPAPVQPDRAAFERIDAALKRAAVQADPTLERVFAEHPGFTLASPPAFRFPVRAADEDVPIGEQLLAAGWGYALLDTHSIQPDDPGRLDEGVIGVASRGRLRDPAHWGALRAWAWGASRALDWLAADAEIDGARIGIEGVSRYGKAALVAMAFDDRFAVGLVGSSGKGGVAPLRRNFGEGVANLATGADHWFAGNFLKYDTRGVSTPDLDASALPVDSNSLLALVAPRPIFISYGIPDQGDAKWVDQRGSFMATVDAARVWEQLGEEGLGTSGAYQNVRMPEVGQGLTDGRIAWRQHAGGHTDLPNVPTFLRWAARELNLRPQP